MDDGERKYRSALGYIEHVGSISLARHHDQLPPISWEAVEKETCEQHVGPRKGPLEYMPIPIEGLWASWFVCHGRLPLHVDEVGSDMSTLGLIAVADEDLELNAGGRHVEASPGDMFVLDPARRHGAETKGMLVFGARDLRKHELPKADKARRMFMRDLTKIAKRYGRKSG